MSPASRPDNGFEIQIHSGGRGRVRYLRCARIHLVLASALALLYLVLIAIGAGLAPGVIGVLQGSEEYRGMAAERARQGERLQALVAKLEDLQARGEALLQQMRKVNLVYDLPPVAANPAPASATLLDSRSTGAAPPGGSIYAGAVHHGERLRQRVHGQIAALEAALDQAGGFESAHPGDVRDTPATCPLRGARYVLTNPFGRQRSAFTRDFGFHAGIDLAAPRGTPILAPADGEVVFAGTYPLSRSPVWWRYGNLVAVAHGRRFLTLYGHCGTIEVARGRRVRRGERLATVGSSGWSLSPHLHYEVRKRGPGGEPLPVDPLAYILDRQWPNEERLLARARRQAPARDDEPLPPGLDRPGHFKSR